MLKQRIFETLFAAFFAAYLTAMVFVFSSSEPSCPLTNCQRYQDRKTETGKGQKDESIWHWMTQDAAGFFTLWLVIVGGGQLVMFWIQLGYIRASLIDAKIAANATALSARAAIALQLPIIRAKPHILGYGESRNGEARTENCSVHFLTFFNLGTTKAFPIEVRYGWTLGEKLPEEPTFRVTEIFSPNLIIEPNPKAELRKFLQSDMPLRPSDWSLICGGKLPLWFYCNFGYADFMGTRHSAVFCWRWQNIGLGVDWRVDDTPAYNRKT